MVKCIVQSACLHPKPYSTSLHAATLAAFCRFFGALASPDALDETTLVYTREAPVVAAGLEATLQLEYDEIDQGPHKDHWDSDSDDAHSITDSYSVVDRTVNVTAFVALDVPVPSSPAAAATLAEQLVAFQKEALDVSLQLNPDSKPGTLIYFISQFFLTNALVNQEVAEIVRDHFLRIVEPPLEVQLPPRDKIVPDFSHTPTPAKVSTQLEDTLSSESYPNILPARSKEFFDTPEGFGDWHIYISNTAVSHLRGFRRADKKIFSIIQKVSISRFVRLVADCHPHT